MPDYSVAQNGFSFDNPRITRLMNQLGLSREFIEIVKGFADSLQIFQKLLSERRKNKEKFSVNALLNDFLPGENFHCKFFKQKFHSLHNAIDDVKFKKNCF